jgi:orotate phosphoribosyltransferase
MEPLRFAANRATARSRVFGIIKAKSFAKGDFVLASGKTSRFYLDMKPTMMDPEAAALLPELILEKVEGVPFDCIGGLEMGAVPLIAPVTIEAYRRGRSIPGFFVRQRVKDHGTKKRIDGSDVSGRTALILDDVTTTGGSAMEAAEAVRDAGGAIAMVLAIVDRNEGAVEFFRERGIPFAYLYSAEEFLADA